MITGASLRVFSSSSHRSSLAAITIAVAFFSLMPLATCASNQERFEGVVVSATPFMGPPRYFLNISRSGLIRLLVPQKIPMASIVGWRVVVEGSMETQGRPVIQASSIRPVSPTAASATKLPSIMMLASFSDLAPSKTRTELNNMAVQAQGYYSEVSYGKVKVTGRVVTDWKQMPNNWCYYGQDDDDSWMLIEDAVHAFDGEVNFGKHNYVVVTHAGNGEEASPEQCDIHSVQWDGLLIWTNDFILVTHGAIIPETEPSPYSPFGVWVHEYGHELGLPDLYKGGDPVGPWDLMASGNWNGYGATPAHPSAYCKIRKGWIGSTQITIVNAGSKSTVTIGTFESSSSGKLVVKLPLADGKYYLIEYRRKIGYDAALPDAGTVITLVDPSKVYVEEGLVTVMDRNPGTSTLDDAAFRTGESYNNPSTGIVVSVVSTSASSAVILVDRTQST